MAVSSHVRGSREALTEALASVDDAPPRPTSSDLDAQGFERAQPVRWLHPAELVRTGVRALLASVFGTYADRREMEAALHAFPAQPEFDYSVQPPRIREPTAAGATQDQIWIDFMADTGDGFAATYTMARLLAEPALDLGGQPTARGSILILGGDEVYPAATRAAYENRMVGPYRAALPWVQKAHAPHVFAIPGNHDWYDGLAAFLRLFTQGRWLGGWKTQQSRSYFALRLPHNYWLWGTDIQLAAEIDGPQLAYFRAASEQLHAGDRVILCTAEPCWVQAKDEPDKYRNLAFLIEKFIDARDAEAVLILTGDSHHYARYALETRESGSPCRTQMYITAGGGGAFLHGTHTLPDNVELPGDVTGSGADGDGTPTSGGPAERARLIRKKRFPVARDSRRLLLRAWAFPLDNPEFVALWSGVWLVLSWALQSGSLGPADDFSAGSSFLGRLAFDPDTDILGVFWHSAYHSPLGLVFFVLLVGGCIAYTNTSLARRVLIGTVHAGLQLGGWLLTLRLTLRLLAKGAEQLTHLLPSVGHLEAAVPPIGLLLGALLAGGISGAVFALFLCFAGFRLPKQLNDAFSALGVEDFKNFIRLRIAPDGSLTVFPVGVRRVVHDFRVNLDPNALPGAPFIDLKGKRVADLVELIERPVVLPPDTEGKRAAWDGASDPR